MPITFPGNKSLTLYAADGGYSTVAPVVGSGQLVVSGSGFGGAPNVVLFRRFTDGTDLSAIPTTPATGDIGTFDSVGSSRYYAMPDGKTAYASYNNDAGTQSILQLSFSAAQKYRVGHSTMVPVGKYFPNATAVETIPTGSNWKMDWLLYDGNANNDFTEADQAVPNKGNNVAFTSTGNSIQGSSWLTAADVWDWNGWNTFSYWQDCGASPQVDASIQQMMISSATIAGSKTTGTYTVTKNTASFNPTGAASGGVLLDANCAYQMIKSNAYFERAVGAEADTQAVRRNWYLAIGDNSRQHILLGNAASLSDCTQTAHIPHDSWSDTEVKFTPDEFEYTLFTHYFITKPDGSIVSGGLS